jgi:hypothetical protein
MLPPQNQNTAQAAIHKKRVVNARGSLACIDLY